MKFVKTFLEKFEGCKFTPGELAFQYGTTLYPVSGMTGRHIQYDLGGDRPGSGRGSLGISSDYTITGLFIQRRIIGSKIVFQIN